MSIKSHKLLPKARRLGIGWMAIGLLGAVGVGLTGIAFISEKHIKLEDPETLFIVMSQVLFHPLVGGFLLAAILAAIMSTISSQLLVTSSSLTEDFYKLVRGEDKAAAHQKEFVMVGRLSVLVVAIVAIAIAWHQMTQFLTLWVMLGQVLVLHLAHLYYFHCIGRPHTCWSREWYDCRFSSRYHLDSMD